SGQPAGSVNGPPASTSAEMSPRLQLANVLYPLSVATRWRLSALICSLSSRRSVIPRPSPNSRATLPCVPGEQIPGGLVCSVSAALSASPCVGRRPRQRGRRECQCPRRSERRLRLLTNPALLSGWPPHCFPRPRRHAPALRTRCAAAPP